MNKISKKNVKNFFDFQNQNKNKTLHTELPDTARTFTNRLRKKSEYNFQFAVKTKIFLIYKLFNKSLAHKLVHKFKFRNIIANKSGVKSYQNIVEKCHLKSDGFRTLNVLNKTFNNLFSR